MHSINESTTHKQTIINTRTHMRAHFPLKFMKILYLFVKNYVKPKRFNQEETMRFHKLMMSIDVDARRKPFELRTFNRIH